MDQGSDKNWQDLCQAASTEQDPKKLMMLVTQIIKKLDDPTRRARPAVVNSKDKDQDCEGSSFAPVYEVGQKDQTCESALSI
jgi:hypothetical protein